MDIVNFPMLSTYSFWGVAIVWSTIQGIAGYWYGIYIYDSSEVNRFVRPKYVKPFAYGFHHGAFYFLCSISGFIAWCLALKIAEKINIINDWSAVSGGTATILTALLLIAVLGVSGALPRILFLGRYP